MRQSGEFDLEECAVAVTVRNAFAIVIIAAGSALSACGGANPAPSVDCHTPVIGLVQLLYPVPNSTAVPASAGVVIYGIAQPFPSSGTISGQGPFPIAISGVSGQVPAQPTSMPSPLPSPMATPVWPADQQSEVYAVSIGSLTRGTTYTVNATVPTYVCGTPNIQTRTQSLGTFST